MLAKLQRKLVAIIMALVGVMLIAVITMIVMNSQNSFVELVETSLNMALEERGDFPAKDDEATSSAGHIGVVWVDVTSEGVMLATNQNSVSIDSSSFEAAFNAALTQTENSGSLKDYHVMWKRGSTPFGLRIAMADTTILESKFQNLLLKAIGIGLIAFAGLFVVAMLLSKWALKPVEKAWEQQHQFVADASHELKTPLAVILANTQILKSNEKDIPEESRRWIDSTADEAERMRLLVEELLELARTEESAGSTRRNINVDLSDIVEGETMQFDAVAFERSCTIESDIEENLHVMGDPDQLERLIKTLIDNACKYAPEDSTIRVNLEKRSNNAELSVTNQGAPIDEEDLKHIFDRFYRSDKARARETGGFGLGLAIARGIAESHNGKIKATSTLADGTTFSVKLPLASSKV